jgi:hypothetical protein
MRQALTKKTFIFPEILRLSKFGINFQWFFHSLVLRQPVSWCCGLFWASRPGLRPHQRHISLYLVVFQIIHRKVLTLTTNTQQCTYLSLHGSTRSLPSLSVQCLLASYFLFTNCGQLLKTLIFRFFGCFQAIITLWRLVWVRLYLNQLIGCCSMRDFAKDDI